MIYKDNNAQSSINIDKATNHATRHVYREGFMPKSSKQEWRHLNLYSHANFMEAEKAMTDYVDMVSETYYQRVKRRMKSKNYTHEAVINMLNCHTREDCERAIKLFEDFFGYKVTSWGLHKDEGYWKGSLEDKSCKNPVPFNQLKQKIFIANVHLHIDFCSLDQNGINLFRNGAINNATRMREFQTKLADTLGMERGVFKEVSGRKHLKPKDYKATLNLIHNLTLDKIAELNTSVRDALKDLKAVRKDYAEMESIFKEAKQRLKMGENVSQGEFCDQLQKMIDKVQESAAKSCIDTIKTYKFEQDDNGNIVCRRASRQNGLKVAYAAVPYQNGLPEAIKERMEYARDFGAKEMLNKIQNQISANYVSITDYQALQSNYNQLQSDFNQLQYDFGILESRYDYARNSLKELQDKHALLNKAHINMMRKYEPEKFNQARDQALQQRSNQQNEIDRPTQNPKLTNSSTPSLDF